MGHTHYNVVKSSVRCSVTVRQTAGIQLHDDVLLHLFAHILMRIYVYEHTHNADIKITFTFTASHTKNAPIRASTEPRFLHPMVHGQRGAQANRRTQPIHIHLPNICININMRRRHCKWNCFQFRLWTSRILASHRDNLNERTGQAAHNIKYQQNGQKIKII